MIGPLTFVGWLTVFGVVALVGLMAKLGWHGRWTWGALLSLPFDLAIIAVELETAGPPLLEDAYGPLLLIFIMGPITVGWLAFLVFALGHQLRRSAHNRTKGHR